MDEGLHAKLFSVTVRSVHVSTHTQIYNMLSAAEVTTAQEFFPIAVGFTVCVCLCVLQSLTFMFSLQSLKSDEEAGSQKETSFQCKGTATSCRWSLIIIKLQYY